MSGAAAELCAGSFSVNTRITPAVENRKYDHVGAFDQEIDEVGESAEHGT